MTRLLWVGLLVVCGVPGVPAPGRAEDECDPKVVLEGRVVDEAGRPVAGAVLAAPGRAGVPNVSSDGEGRFRLPLPTTSHGGIYASVFAEGKDGRLGHLLVVQQKPAPVEVVLKPAREVAVQVRDGEGKPVPEAEVAFLAITAPIVVGRTDAKGLWRARVPFDAVAGPADADSWVVFARKGGVGFDYALAGRARDPTLAAEPLSNALTLTLEGARTLRVKAVAPDGRPLAGVTVGPSLIQMPDHGWHINLSGMTDAWPTTGADGVAVLDWLPERFEGSSEIIAQSKDHYARDHAAQVLADAPADEVTVTMLPLERLSGRVTHADGRPAEGIIVQARGYGAGEKGFQGNARTDADGRFALRAYAEQAYIVTVADEEWAAPYRADIVLRAGKPVDGIDFVLGRPTRLHGRVTVGTDEKPAPKVYLSAVIDRGQIPEEIRRKDDPYYRGVSMTFGTQTDDDGRFEFRLSPGEYSLRGPARTEPFTVTIPAAEPPAEVRHDFHMPRAEAGPFAGRVVDGEGRPVAGAVVRGMYASWEATRWFRDQTTDAEGRFATERSLDPLVLHARSADKALAGVARVDAEATEAEIVVRPTATAAGHLTDPEGRPIARGNLEYGIRIYQGEPGVSPFSVSFGGSARTGDDGRFTIEGLVPGQPYQITLKVDDRTWNGVTELTPASAGVVALGHLSADPNPRGPYVPPTPEKRASDAFTSRAATPPRARLDTTLVEARREYTRPLLVFGRPDDPACVDLFRLLNERPEDANEGEESGPSPASLRWEFELLALDDAQPEVRQLAESLGVTLDADRPRLVVLDDDGKPSATYPLQPGEDGMLAPGPLAAFLAEHKLPTRDAARTLAEALAQARTDDKRVFLIFSASWCGPCRLLARFLDAHKAELAPHYVFVKLDVSRDLHADELQERYKESKRGGIPWYAILDADGAPLATSNAPGPEFDYGSSNIGFPSEPRAIAHFARMLEQTAPRLPAETLEKLRLALSQKSGDAPEAKTEELPAIVAESTLVAFLHDTPPPWPNGNCFRLSTWTRADHERAQQDRDAEHRRPPTIRVANMHRENFEAIVAKEGLDTVRVVRLPGDVCLIDDPRIPRDWLLETPCATCLGKDRAEALRAEHPGQFHAP